MFFFSSRRRHTRCALGTGVQTCAIPISGRLAAQSQPLPGRLLAGRHRARHWQAAIGAHALGAFFDPGRFSEVALEVEQNRLALANIGSASCSARLFCMCLSCLSPFHFNYLSLLFFSSFFSLSFFS